MMKKSVLFSIISCIVLICLVWFLSENPFEIPKEEMGSTNLDEGKDRIGENKQEDGDKFVGGLGGIQSELQVLSTEKVLSTEELQALPGGKLPIFRQAFYYDTTGIIGNLTEEDLEEIDARLKAFLQKAGVTLPESLEPSSHSLQNGIVVYTYEGNLFVGKPSGISCSIPIDRTNLTEKEMLEVIAKLPYVAVTLEEFEIETPVISVKRVLKEDGTLSSISFKLYEEGKTAEEKILNSTFRYVKVEWATMTSGNVLISFYPNALGEEVAAETVKTFANAVAASEFAKDAELVVPSLSEVEIVYRTDGHPQYFVPYYKWESGSETFYVPAVEWKQPE